MERFEEIAIYGMLAFVIIAILFVLLILAISVPSVFLVIIGMLAGILAIGYVIERIVNRKRR